MEYLWWGLVFSIGAIVGSFLNVCICRLPVGESLAYPSSHCEACGQGLRPVDLVPIFSFVFLRGRCRYCGCRIAWHYPVGELVTGLLFVAAVAKYGVTLSALRTVLLFSILVPATVIDLKYKIIPDRLNLAGLILGVPLIFESKEVFGANAAGFLAGGGLLLLIAVVSRGGMGGGDIKLAAVLGLLLGWKYLLAALFLAFMVGSIAGIIMIVFKLARMKEPIPFGPYLALGAVVAALTGDKVIKWYTGFWGA
ncbi:MAG: Type 4 prepilin-like proteins leader peptide-processing enzyme [Pelotomaculum sp. PtaB.Bin104]|nr:MAG: Type 4 prepilin-like proteins leader peptide-processing enzyme [Pelotomaculum sp. PtaB.Bin104]